MAVIPRTVILLPEGKGSVLSRCIPAVHKFVSVSFTRVIKRMSAHFCVLWLLVFYSSCAFPKAQGTGRTSHLLFLTCSTSLKDKSEKHRNQCFISTSSTFLIPNLLLVPIPSADNFQHCLCTDLSSAEHRNGCDQAATWPNYRKCEQ